MLVPPPDLPTLPSASCRMQAARVLLLPTWDWVSPMHQITMLGRFSAMTRATRSTWSGVTPVIRSTSSGV
jgi:hypothetical protein